MNCKPGDLAVVRGADWTKELNNRYVVVQRLAMDFEWQPVPGSRHAHSAVWICIPASGGTLPVRKLESGRLVEEASRPIGDRFLRPIRDPGDDAVDESAAWLPPVPLPAIDPNLLPTKETA